MEQTETPQPSLYQHAAKFGGIMSGITIFIVIVFYVVSVSFLVTLKFLAIVLVLGIGIVIYAGINYRSEVGGYLPYGKAFLHGMTTLAVAGIISTVFNILLYHVIDPELPQKMTDAILLNTEEMMRSFGTPEGTIDEQLSDMKTEMPKQFTIGGLAFGYVKALGWYAGIALITSLFVRKNVPVEM